MAELYYRLGIILLDKKHRKESLDVLARAMDMDYAKHDEIFEYAPVLKSDQGNFKFDLRL